MYIHFKDKVAYIHQYIKTLDIEAFKQDVTQYIVNSK